MPGSSLITEWHRRHDDYVRQHGDDARPQAIIEADMILPPMRDARGQPTFSDPLEPPPFMARYDPSWGGWRWDFVNLDLISGET